MNLAWHQFRKDARQFRLFLALWFGLLLLDVAVNLGWVGRVAYSSTRGFDRASNTWTTILPGVIWALAGLLPSLAVLADSPARRDGFLATRPLPKRDLLVAKIAFVLALIVAPWVLQEFIHLLFSGMPAWVIGRGTWERLVLTLPVALGFAAFAALWPGPARWARALGILFASYVLLAVIISLCTFYLHIIRLSLGAASGLVTSYVIVAGLMILALWHSCACRSAAARWGGLILVLVMSSWLASLFASRSTHFRPADQSQATAIMAQAGFEIPSRAISLSKEVNSDEAEHPRFAVSVDVKTKPLPPGQVVEWSGKDAKLSRAAGGGIPGEPNIFYAELFRGNPWNNSYSPADFAAWASEFPEDVLFHVGYIPGQYMPTAVHLGSFNLPTNLAEITQPLTLRASLEARVFQWRKIADLPLTRGATATNEFGSWKFVATEMDRPARAIGCLYVERSQISFSAAADSRCSSVGYGPLSRMVWMVYDPARHGVWMPDYSDFSSASRGNRTALVRYFITLRFYNSDNSFLLSDTKRCRLVIFEKTWIGSAPESWQSDSFTLDEKLQSPGPIRARNTQSMSRDEFDRRAADLSVPAPDAARGEVSRYLLEALQLVDAYNGPLRTNDQVGADLARFVPGHLDLFIDTLPVADWAVSSAVIRAIELGATDAQKPAVIAALPRNPTLATVLLARGWVNNARPEIGQLIKSPRELPLDAMRAIAGLHDPETYPRMFEEFEAHPSVPMDDLLRVLPGMETELNAIVARRWREDSLVLRTPTCDMFGDWFVLAMRHGETSALHRAYQLLDDRDFARFSDPMNLGASLVKTVQMTGLAIGDRYDSKKALAWMRHHRPEDFVFDPAQRQFVLKRIP